jgi:DNA-directed RNA polymerase specialized sigma24 family protein
MSVEAGSTDEPIRQLLRRLGSSDQTAGDAYEALRRLVCRYFEVRGVIDAEGLADDVLDRVSRRIYDGIEIDDIQSYARGVARLVLLESRRRPSPKPLPVDSPALSDSQAVTHEAAARCLDHCLDRLDTRTQTNVMAYYAEDGRRRIDGRKRLAETLGVRATAVRLRMLRLRLALERCVRECIRGELERNSRPRPSTDR